jgi:queuine tRNA-ribosyltransferase
MIHLTNAGFRADAGPLAEGCRCYACQNFSRAYVRHLIKSDELTGLILISRHNVHFYLELMREIRAAIAEGRFDAYRREFFNRYRRSQYEKRNVV